MGVTHRLFLMLRSNARSLNMRRGRIITAPTTCAEQRPTADRDGTGARNAHGSGSIHKLSVVPYINE